MTSNLAMLRVPTRQRATLGTGRPSADFVAVGGLFRRPLANAGLMLARGRSHQFAADRHPHIPVPPHGAPAGRVAVTAATQWHLSHLMDGRHPGCLEARRLPYKLRHRLDGRTACEFDGRVSLARLGEMYLLFVRLNAAQSGQRYVQVSSSADLEHGWSPFEPIAIEGLGMAERPSLNLYFLLATAHPTLPSTLVALLPTVHRGVGCISVSLSRDGHHWSALLPLAPSHIDVPHPELPAPRELLESFRGERTTSQPAAGIHRIGSRVVFFVHENVAGIANVARETRSLRPRLRRYEVAVERFHEWSLLTLSQCSSCVPPRATRRPADLP